MGLVNDRQALHTSVKLLLPRGATSLLVVHFKNSNSKPNSASVLPLAHAQTFAEPLDGTSRGLV